MINLRVHIESEDIELLSCIRFAIFFSYLDHIKACQIEGRKTGRGGRAKSLVATDYTRCCELDVFVRVLRKIIYIHV